MPEIKEVESDLQVHEQQLAAQLEAKSKDLQTGDKMGWSVDIHGNYAIVGAPEEDGGSGDPLALSGAAYIFYRKRFHDWDED